MKIPRQYSIRSLIFLAIFQQSLQWFAVGFIFPVMSLFILKEGVNYFQLGIVMAVYSGAVILAELPTGGLADTIGRKPTYISALLFLMAGSSILIFFSGFSMLITGFFVMGIGRALSSGALDAYFIDAILNRDSNADIQKIMAKSGFAVPLALGCGSLLGGFLPDWTAGGLLPQIFTNPYTTNFIVYFALNGILAVFILIFIHEPGMVFTPAATLKGIKQLPDQIRTSVRFGLKTPIILILMIGTMIWGFSISSLEQFWQPRVQEITVSDGDSWIFGVLGFGYFLAASLGSLLSIPLCRICRDNYVLVMILSRFLMGAFLIALAFQAGLPMFSLFYFVVFAFNGLSGPSGAALFNRAVPSEKRSTMLSLESLFLQIGGIGGSLLLGGMARVFSIRTAWIFAGLLLLLFSLIYVFIPFYSGKVSCNVVNEDSEASP